LNAANEIAVAAFLGRRIRFDQIYRVVMSCMEFLSPSFPNDLNDLLELDREARFISDSLVQKLSLP
jgi:1-deoxy-D-xylulose-5-phosphate reductoisomerase